VLTGQLPPHAAFIAAHGTIAPAGNDSVVLRGDLESPVLNKRVVTGWMARGRMHFDLWWANDSTSVAGTIEASPDSTTRPLRDYPAIAAGVERAITDNVYDPALPQGDKLRRFFRIFRDGAAKSFDDLDIVAAFQAAKPSLPSSHYEFIRNPRIDNAPIDSLLAGETRLDPASHVQLQLPAPGLAYLWVRRWDRVGAVIDRAVVRMEAARTTTLMLDLRANPGGDNTLFAPLAHLIGDTMTIGTMLARGSHSGAPLPTLTSEASMRDILDAIRIRGGAIAKVLPRQPHFTGKVYVLTSGRTGSASEPLVYALKSTKRAVVIGERTGGAVLMALPHSAGEGFIVTVPESDYRTWDGVRLEGNGVTPDIHVASKDALIAAGKEVSKTMPFAGAAWLANVYASLGRTKEAGASLELALRLAPTDSARASMQRRVNNFRAAQLKSAKR